MTETYPSLRTRRSVQTGVESSGDRLKVKVKLRVHIVRKKTRQKGFQSQFMGGRVTKVFLVTYEYCDT